MARDSAEEKWEHSDFVQEEEQEEDEALSLCDLPDNLIKEENESSNKEEAQATVDETNQEDFDFGPWGGSLSTKSEMCAADDIFFQGQILPLRLSVSSESGANKVKQDSSLNPSRCVSRSESMDHNSVGGFTSFSSRSSSSRSSHYSSSSTSSSVATAITRISKPRIQSQYFHSHPSPKPQIRLSSTSLGSNAGSNRNRNSSVWEFFRLGLVRTPEIELQDLKVRSSVSRNSSSSSSNSNPSVKNISKINSSNRSSIKFDSCHSGKNMEKQRKQSFLEKGGGLLSGCSCSVSAAKPVPFNIIFIKSGNSTENSNNDKNEKRGSIEEKLQELKMKKRMVQKQQQQQQGKQAMSRHRTFEWIKELSHASYLDHEEEA